jgi:hypothetical protein
VEEVVMYTMDKVQLWRILKSFQKLGLTPDDNLVTLANDILVKWFVIRNGFYPITPVD